MASTYQIAGPITPSDEATIAGVRRSRFSLHLNSRHVRRWLLVQLVSIPNDEAANDGHSSAIKNVHPDDPTQCKG